MTLVVVCLVVSVVGLAVFIGAPTDSGRELVGATMMLAPILAMVVWFGIFVP